MKASSERQRLSYGRVGCVVVLGWLTVGMSTVAAQSPPVTATDCLSSTADPTCDPDWTLKQTGVARAKQRIRDERHEEPGQGIVVAVLDTGYAVYIDPGKREFMHPELGNALLVDRGYSFECDSAYDDSGPFGDPCPCAQEQRPAHDRMSTSSWIPMGRQPGHGTRTMSVLASPDGAQVTPSPNAKARVDGVAPGVRVVPLRATQGAVLMEKRAWDMSRAIARAVLDDPERREPTYPPVDVISMSFGRRAPWPHLEKAVLMAERRGVIVVAAAGQGSIDPHGGAVRFPAQYPSVVAVGGTTVDARPWSGLFYSSGKGESLDVAAPAVGVWRASAEGPWDGISFSIGRGDGTSFATPQVAGAAALWLQWYGREALQERYGREAISPAFIMHLRTSGVRSPSEMARLATEEDLPNAADIAAKARQPWPENMGPGILAADKLIALPLESLPTRQEVCTFVYEQRGAEALASLCPARNCPSHPAADCAHDQMDTAFLKGALRRPAYHIDPRNSVVVGIAFGAPFGTGADTGEWYSPVLSVGLIRGRHQFEFPSGLIVEAKGGEHGVAVGVGYAEVQEYGPLRDAEGKYTTIPGFGGLLAFSARAGYLFTEDTSHLGGELAFSLYRATVNVGLWRALDSNPPKKIRFTASLGFGF